MSLLRVLDIAATALQAQSLRLNTTASNLANADSAASSAGGTYRARHPVFAPIYDGIAGDPVAAGVRSLGIVESGAPLKVVHRPEHPLADADGNVFFPNVNIVEEMANMISASRSYETSVEVANTSKQLLLRTLSMGQ